MEHIETYRDHKLRLGQPSTTTPRVVLPGNTLLMTKI